MSTNLRQSNETLYVCKIVILRATDVPVADLHNLSCDPYVLATLSSENSADPADDTPQVLSFRTHTCRRTLNPVWEAPWIVSGIPASGFLLSLNLRDEDPHNYDDNLGKAVLRIPWPDEPDPTLHEGWESGEREYKVHKRGGSVLSKMFTCMATVFTIGAIGHHVRLWVTVQVLSKAENQEDRRLYTVGPRRYVRHFSPLIGRFLGSSNAPDNAVSPNPNRKKQVKATAFVANRIQLAGPVPETLRHRYVGFAPFVKAMFRRRGFRGIVLHHALHKQYMTLYRWDANTAWGYVGSDAIQSEKNERPREGPDGDLIAEEKQDRQNSTPNVETRTEVKKGKELPADSVAFAEQFLRMTSCGTHSRIFTYVIMLDGEMRFTETGGQLAIEFLSKHTMHSDIEVEIAYSGEFFVRPLRRHRDHCRPSGRTGQGSERPDSHAEHSISCHSNSNPNTDLHTDERHPAGCTCVFDESPIPTSTSTSTPATVPTADGDAPPADPAQYELVIDNDSGTYRPRADLLPTLHGYLASARNLGALGRVTCLNAFDERLVRWKDARKRARQEEMKVKGSLKGGRGMSVGSNASLSSSVSGMGEEDASAGTNTSARVDADGGEEAAKRRVKEEDAKRARDNGDQDREAKEEEKQTSNAN